MKEKREYKVKNGILLQLAFGSSEFYSNANLTDDIAEQYLAKNPQDIVYFSDYPEDWEERVAKSKKSKAITINEELLELMKEALKDGITVLSVVEGFTDYKIDGKKVSKKVLSAHANKALEEIAEEPPIEDEEGQAESKEEDKSPEQTEE